MIRETICLFYLSFWPTFYPPEEGGMPSSTPMCMAYTKSILIPYVGHVLRGKHETSPSQYYCYLCSLSIKTLSFLVLCIYMLIIYNFLLDREISLTLRNFIDAHCFYLFVNTLAWHLIPFGFLKIFFTTFNTYNVNVNYEELINNG